MTQMTTCDLHNETIIQLQKRIEDETCAHAATANALATAIIRGDRAEAKLTECMAHADAMEAEVFNLSAYDSNDAVIAYRAWSAKQ